MWQPSQYVESEADFLSELPLTKDSRTKKMPSILVVDDDPLFCKKIEAAAKKNNMKVKTVRNVGELFTLPREMPFDVAILDYAFGELTAYQVGFALGTEIPILLISNTDEARIHYSEWPFNVKAFVHKSSGQKAILSAALESIMPRFLFSRKGTHRGAPLDSTKTKWANSALFLILLGAMLFVYVLGVMRRPPLEITQPPPGVYNQGGGNRGIQSPVRWDVNDVVWPRSTRSGVPEAKRRAYVDAKYASQR